MNFVFLTQPNVGIIQTFVDEVFFCDLTDIMSIHVRNKFVYGKRNRLSSVIIVNKVFFKSMGFAPLGSINGLELLSVRASSLLLLNNVQYTY